MLKGAVSDLDPAEKAIVDEATSSVDETISTLIKDHKGDNLKLAAIGMILGALKHAEVFEDAL